MQLNLYSSGLELTVDIESVAVRILDTQLPSGEIPWHEGGKTDPWDHVEAAMGLTIAGYHEHALQAYAWMKNMQLPDGSWYAAYQAGRPTDKTRDTNMSAYIAVGVLHYYLITGDRAFLADMWTPVRGAIDFCLRLQAPGGEIHWAKSPDGVVDPMALLTGSSSIYMSIKCALAIAEALGRPRPAWKKALMRLEDALKHKPHLFNMTKSRYSMDWFYPILCGAVSGRDAQVRIDRYWKKFVVEGQGIRCVSDEPWVTVAETSEFILALAAIGNQGLAEIVFSWICDKRFTDGSYWCGHTVPDMVVWPEEKITWTNAVLLMAADALYNLTPASRLFSHRCWQTGGPDSAPMFSHQR